MKSLLLLISFFLLVSPVSAQFFNGSKVPTAVRVQFQQQFPKAKRVNWNLGALGYEVTFRSNRHNHFALFGADGTTIVQTAELTRTDLPRKIRRTLKRNYRDFVMKEAERIENYDGFIYSTRIAAAEEVLTLTFDREGRLRDITPVLAPDEMPDSNLVPYRKSQ